MDDWEQKALLGALAAVVAIVSLLGDRRRMRRADPDAVGFMPWTTIFFFSMVTACVALGLAARTWLGST